MVKVGDMVERTKGKHQGMEKGDIGTVTEVEIKNDQTLVAIKEYHRGAGLHNMINLKIVENFNLSKAIMYAVKSLRGEHE